MFDFFSEKYPFTLKLGAKLLIASRKCKGPSGYTSQSFGVSPPGTSCLVSFSLLPSVLQLLPGKNLTFAH